MDPSLCPRGQAAEPCRGASLPPGNTYLVGLDEAAKEGKEHGGGRGLGVLPEVLHHRLVGLLQTQPIGPISMDPSTPDHISVHTPPPTINAPATPSPLLLAGGLSFLLHPPRRCVPAAATPLHALVTQPHLGSLSQRTPTLPTSRAQPAPAHLSCLAVRQQLVHGR